MSLLVFHLETRSRSVVATSIRSVSTHSVVSGRRHCSLVLVAMGWLLVPITQSLVVGEEQRIQLADRGAVTVSCRQWERRQALDLIRLGQD